MSTTIIDDHDPAVSYSGAWLSGGMAKEYQSTVMSSTTVGSKFTVTFTGTQIDVFATLDGLSAGVVTSYSIDGGQAVQATAAKVNDDSYHQKVWSSSTLSPGKHTLDVTMVSVNKVAQAGEGTIWFDYFAVTNGAAAAAGSTPAATGTPGTSTTLSNTSTAGKSTKSPSSTSSGSSAAPTNNNSKDNSGKDNSGSNNDAGKTAGSSSNNHTGAIVGGVLAALLLVLAAVAFFLFWRHRKKKASKLRNADSFEKFFNNPPHSDAVPQTPTSTHPLVASEVAVAGYNGPFAAATQQPYNPYASTAPPIHSSPAPSSYNTSVVAGSQGGRRPSLDNTSVTSSSAMAPSQRYLYAHNSDNVLAYGAPGVYSSKAAEAAAEAAQAQSQTQYSSYSATSASASSSAPPQIQMSFGTLTPLPAPGSYDPDSVAELKRRQQQAVAEYNAGIAQGMSTNNNADAMMNAHQFVQHVDSGIRGPVVPPVQGQPVELPPAYSAA